MDEVTEKELKKIRILKEEFPEIWLIASDGRDDFEALDMIKKALAFVDQEKENALS